MFVGENYFGTHFLVQIIKIILKCIKKVTQFIRILKWFGQNAECRLVKAGIKLAKNLQVNQIERHQLKK